MPADPHESKDSKQQQTGMESVEGLIQKKQSDKASEGATAVAESAAGFQSEVADVMGGMEAASDKIGERVREDKRGDLKTGGGGQSDDDDDDAQQIVQNLKKVKIPSQAVMIKKVRSAIVADIKKEFKKLGKLHKNLATGSANDFNASIAKIRSLKEVLSSLFTGTFDMIKGIYGKYFTREGRRRKVATK